MSSELVQAGFFDIEPLVGDNDEITIVAGWMSLSDDAFKQAATERHRALDQQEAVIDAFKNRIIYEKGELYTAAKAKLGHGNWLKWLEEIDVSDDKAETYIQIVRNVGNELSNSDRGRNLSYRLWRGIARSPERKQIVTKIETGEIEPTPTAINTELEAARQRADKAEIEARNATRQTSIIEQQLSRERYTTQIEIERYNRQIAELQAQMHVKEVIPPEIAAQVEENEGLREKIKALTEQRNNLAKEAERLSEVAREVARKDLVRMNEDRIRKQWRTTCTEFNQAVLRLLSQFPTPIDIQIFEADDWSHLSHAKNTARSFLEACNNLSQKDHGIIVDALEA